MKNHLLFLCLILLLGSCAKEQLDKDIPLIGLIQAGPQQIKANEDSVYFHISYEDANGDLGSQDAKVSNLFVEDMRINLIYEFRIQELVPNAAAVPIRGELHFSLNNTVITGAGSVEWVNYRIWIKDRAGNESNKIIAGSFKVIP
ncbi:MAG: hypothetical protein LPK45_09920 [Bacteroidota bacterium]|nr:hypothetical protein [Bacteroidota bacterium]MDX5431409.1 hypothetical protein [Bacteroidota bacterium]MDX5470137.1 hypothetical protein [Bacteroidota bacterium]